MEFNFCVEKGLYFGFEISKSECSGGTVTTSALPAVLEPDYTGAEGAAAVLEMESE